MKNIITKKKFFKAWLNKWRKMGSRVIPCENCYQWALWLSTMRDDFNTDSKLCIPCEENTFLEVIRCAALPQDRRIFLSIFNNS